MTNESESQSDVPQPQRSEHAFDSKDIPLPLSQQAQMNAEETGSAIPRWPSIAIPGATAVTAKKNPRNSKRPVSQRNLVLFWSIYLLISWAFITKMQLRTDTNMVRGMVLAAMLGLMVLWPLLRLSQEIVFPLDASQILRPLTGGRLARRIASEIWLDWLCLILVFQAVLWPLRIHANWTVQQTLWLDAVMAVWSLLSAAITAWGCRWNCRVHRFVGMLGCLAVLLAEPVLLWITNTVHQTEPIGWHLMLSPVEIIWSMSQQPLDWTPWPWLGRIVVVGTLAVLGWVLLFTVPLPATASASDSDGASDCGCLSAGMCGVKPH